MKRMWIALFGAALVMVFQAVPASADKDKDAAAEGQGMRSTGSHPVVYDDYPESEVVISVTDDIVLTVTGEARTRFEWVENNTDFSNDGTDSLADDNSYDDEYYFAPARFDIGFRVDLPRDVAAVVQLQSGFDFGGNGADATHDRAAVNQALRPAAANPLNDPGASNKLGGPGNNQWGALGGSETVDGARAARQGASDTVHLYQGYIEAAKIGGSIFSLRFGRQELAYGSEFLLGNQDFYDGLSYDGIKGIFQFNDCSRMDVFWTKLAENNLSGNGSGNDIDMYGAYASINSLGGSTVGMDAYIIGETDHRDLVYNLNVNETADHDLILASFPSVTSDSDGNSFKDSWWAGVRFFRDRDHGLHFSGELTYQFGSVNANFNDSANVPDNNVDIDAWAFEGFMGWTWNTATHPDVHWGLTWASGSDLGNYDSGKSRTFFTPAGEIHPRLGLMDLVEASNIQAYNLGYAGMHGNHSWGVDVFHFELDKVPPEQEFAILGNTLLDALNGGGMSTDLGNEFDVYYNYQYTKNLVAQFAIGYFDPGTFIDDVNQCQNGGCNTALVAPVANVIGTNGAVRAYANLLLRF